MTVAGGILTGNSSNGALNTLVVGRNGSGSLTLSGGSIVAEKLFVTNNGAGFTNSLFAFNFGTLTTLSNSTLVSPGSFQIGTSSGQTAEWRMLGGTTTITNLGGTVSVGGGNAIGRVIVDGPATMWSNKTLVRISSSSGGSEVVVTNGAQVSSGGLQLGNGFGENGNRLLITGSNSAWADTDTSQALGLSTASNRLSVLNGGSFSGSLFSIGALATATNNILIVSNTGSRVSLSGFLRVGDNGAANQMLILGSGRLSSDSASIGQEATANKNLALVSGTGSVWSNTTTLTVGFNGSSNQLNINNGGAAISSGLIVGARSAAQGNTVNLTGGSLTVTNTLGNADADIRRGTVTLNTGTVTVNNLIVTNNSQSFFNLLAGTLNVSAAAVSNGQTFVIGDGTNGATLNFTGNRTNLFANGLIINTNATLTGNGRLLAGTVTNRGNLSPGNSAGALRIDGSLTLAAQSSMTFEIGGLIATNQYDQVTVTNFVQFAGTLSLSLLNNFLPAPANQFTLVSFGSASGSFANLSGGRVSLTNNLASFAVTQTATNLILGGVTYTDTDGDGQGDLQELAAGTDPNGPGSFLQITSITQNGSGHYLVRFQSVALKNYTVEFSNDLVTWNPAAGATFTNPAAGLSEFADTGALTGGLAVSSRSYRIRLAP